MNKLKKINTLLLFLLVCYFNSAIAKESDVIDSLIKVCSTLPNDTLKLKIFAEIAETAPDGVWEEYNLKMRNLSLDLMKDSNKSIAQFAKKYYAEYINNVAFEYALKGNYKKALDNFNECIKLQKEVNDKNGLALSYSSIGAIYERQGDVDKAIEPYSIALAIEEQTQDLKDMTATLNNIAVIYGKKHNVQKQLEYYQRAVSNIEKIKLNNQVVPSVYRGMGDILEKQKKHDEALFYYQKGLKVSEDLGDAIGRASCLNGIATVYFHKNELAKALVVAKQGFSIAISAGYPLNIKDASHTLKLIHQRIGNYKDALVMYELEVKTMDSLNSKENQKALLKHQMQYEFDIKQAKSKSEQDKKDAIAKEEIQNQKIIRNFLFSGLFLLLLFAGFVFRSLHISRKQKIIIEKEKQRAEESEKFKQQFLASMSHEIRTPMNAVLGMTNLTLDTVLTPQQNKYLTAVKHSSENLLVIINDILDLSKLEAGKMELEQIPFLLKEQLKQVNDTMQFKAEEKGLLLKINLIGNLPPVLIGDPSRLNQILINLVGNAIKFTDKGSVTIQVTPIIPTVEDSSKISLKFSVIDTGIGIPKDKIDKLFSSFTQVDAGTSRKYGGTGLGLSISKTLVELHGGAIGVNSEEGIGSEFSFSIQYPIGDTNALSVEKEQKSDFSALQGIKILVAEDNEYNQIVIVDTLKNLINEVEVDIATDGKMAIDMHSIKKYDLILMDVNMPIMDGLEATRLIRLSKSHNSNSEIPIIALTASVLTTDLDKCTIAGMNGYVPKPFKREELLFTLSKFYNNPKGISKSTNKKNEVENESIFHLESSNNRVTDLSFLSNFCEGDSERLNKYIQLYLTSTPSNIEKIKQAIYSKDYQTLSRIVHTMKPHLNFMGMKKTKELAERIENYSNNGIDNSYLISITEQLIDSCLKSLEELC